MVNTSASLNTQAEHTAFTHTAASQGSFIMPDVDDRSSNIVALLLRRLSDAALGTVVAMLISACEARPVCRSVLRREQDELRSAISLPTTEFVANTSQVGSKHGTDIEFNDGSWRLLFGTPLYMTPLENFEQLNVKLRKLLYAEVVTGRPARSLVGNGWRTDDGFLQRKDPAITRLYKLLLNHAEKAVNFGQARPMKFEMHLSGWAVSLGAGGSTREHVHPTAAWSGVYYVHANDPNDGGGSAGRGGCLRLSDPRPGAMMVTMGANDRQFMESRTICPRSGLLVLFPAWLSHSVTPLEAESTQQEKRMAIAFNVHAVEKDNWQA